MSSLPKRDWFQAGDGIAREVISADIQRYLGRDATVRPGYGTGEEEGVAGYWINAHRNLTTAQVEDLKRDSQSWLNERRSQATDVSYANSSTFASSRGQTYSQHSQHSQHAHAEPPRADYAHPQSAQPTYQYSQQQYAPTESAQTGYTYNQGQPANYYPQNSGYSAYTPQQTAASQASQPRTQYGNYPAATTHQQAGYPQYPGYAPQQAGYPQTNPQQQSGYPSHAQQSAQTPAYYQTPTSQASSQTYPYPQGYPQQPNYSQYQQPPRGQGSGRRQG